MVFKLFSSILLLLISINFIACNSAQVSAAKKLHTEKELSEKLSPHEAQIIYWLALSEINRSSNCIMSDHIFTNNTRVAHCFTLKGHTLRTKYKNIDNKYAYEGMPTVSIEEINTTMQTYLHNIDTLTDEYLALKSELTTKIKNIHYAKPKFKNYQQLLEGEFQKPQDFYIKYRLAENTQELKSFHFVMPYTPSNAHISKNFVLLKYYKPENIFFLYKKAQTKNQNLSLAKFMQMRLPIAYVRDNVSINSNKAKFHLKLSLKNLDENRLGYSLTQANIQKSIICTLKNLQVNFFPNSFSAADDALEIVFKNQADKNLIVSNKTNKYIQINALSFYYDTEILTQEVDYKLPPTATQKFTFDLKKIDKKYLNKKSIKIALALEYEDHSDTKITIYETKNLYRESLIK